MKDQPLVTIITPSFNHAAFIRETIDSVLSQDYPNIEYIIMDGGSADGTAEVVNPYLDQLTFISEKDRGQSHAINKGFAVARGQIVAWLNSDDLFLPGAVSNAVAAFKNHPSAAVVYGEGYQIDISGNIKCVFPHTQPFDLWRLTHLSDYILQQTVFFRKSALDVVGPLREDLNYVMDWDILIRLGKQFDFIYIPKELGCLREYEAAKTFSGGLKRVHEIRRLLSEHTGTRLPRGYIIYGLDTYAQIANAKIAQWPQSLNALKGPLSKLIERVAHRILGHVATHGGGRYRDGWLSRRAFFMIRKGCGDIVFRGELPDVRELDGQTITISVNGRRYARKRLKPGKFELRFAAPEKAKHEAVTLTVTFTKAFVPTKIGVSEDCRALSAFFEDIMWVTDNH